MTDLFPYQIGGGDFLAEKRRALLADKVRVGKTGSAIRAADVVGAEDILWMTKGVARRKHVEDWLAFQTVKRKVTPVYSGADKMPSSGVIVTSYDLAAGSLFERLRGMKFDAVVPDESHRLRARSARRTRAVYGPKFDGEGGLIEGVDCVWPMSGEPAPNHYGELWTMMRAVLPESLLGVNGKPLPYHSFVAKFCKVRNNGFGDQIVGSKNSAELRARLAPFVLRRTLTDVRGDHPELMYDTLPLDAAARYLTELKALEREDLVREFDARLRAAHDDDERERILNAVDKKLALRLRRITGLAKVVPLAEWVAEQIEDGVRKLVIFAHHRDVIEGLQTELWARGVSSVKVYGGMSALAKDAAQLSFLHGAPEVCIGQLETAGEAIDLSAADQAVLCEWSYVPGDNIQAAHRVVNVNKMVSTLARFAVLAGSIDERILQVVLRKTKELTALWG